MPEEDAASPEPQAPVAASPAPTAAVAPSLEPTAPVAPPPAKSAPAAQGKLGRRPLAVGVAGVVLVSGLLGWVAATGGSYQRLALGPAAGTPSSSASPTGLTPDERRLAALAPRGTYVTVDTYANRVRVYQRGELIREAICSTGSGTVLRDPESGRTWVFDTPLGVRQVIRKVRDPVWTKPDWAFIEEGFAPPAGWRDRVDALSLGEYGLYLGDGYIIHGTLFQTLLGQRLTHGCIRLGDGDLEFVFRHVPLGAPVFLY